MNDASPCRTQLRPSHLVRLHRVCCFLVCCVVSVYCGLPAFGQVVGRNEKGLNQLTSERLTLVTDLEIDDELKRWPDYLDQAIDQWRSVFQPPASRMAGLNVRVYLIGDRKKWDALGLTSEVPGLEDGYQLGNRLYIVEQPSVYYRRLLFLHEATHWIMAHWQGGAGAPWLMEGMADYLGTHRLEGNRLQLGFLPQSPSQVPSWGRIKLVSETRASGSAPLLSEILKFRDMREQRMVRYSWSWAAVTFFANHPDFQDEFQALYRGPLDYTLTSSDTLFRSLEERWPLVSIQWRCFVDDLDFGADLKRSSLEFGTSKRPVPISPSADSVSVQADRGWQSSGLIVESTQKINIKAQGRVVVRQVDDSRVWEAEPQGITVEYYRGFPLGTLLGTWASLDGEQPSRSWDCFAIGKETVVQPKERSVLLLRINDRPSGLADNRGNLNVAFRVE